MLRRGLVDVPGGQVHYREAGAGPVVVLIHASPGSSSGLVPLINALADKGLKLARRTITKYRKQMGIPSSRQRREY